MAEKVLILSYYFPPMNGPATQHPLWFFRFLPEHGFETVALTSSIYSGENTDPASTLVSSNVYRLPEGQWSGKLASLLSAAELHIQIRMGLWEHGFIWSWFARRKAVKILKREAVAAIVSTSPSLAGHWTAYRLKKKFPHIRWIADFQDPLVGNPFRRTKPAFRGMESWMEREFFAAADILSANTNTVAAMWQDRYPQYRDKIVTTWGGFDAEEAMSARPIPAGRPARILSHVGAVYGGRLSNPFLDSLYRLWQQNQLRPGDLTVEFFGSNDFSTLTSPENFEKLCAAGIVQVRNTYVPRQEALRVCEEADFLFVLDVTYPHNTKFQVPSKLFDYIRIGRPILAITPKGSPTEYILAGSGIPHVTIDTEAPSEAYDKGILRLLEMSQTPQQPSQWFLDTFDARQLAGGIAKAIRHTPALTPSR